MKKITQVGMKQEWIMNESYRRKKKPRITSLPEKSDELNRMLEEIGDNDVTVSKDMLVKLVRKSTLSLYDFVFYNKADPTLKLFM